jgi:hypothetical protein
MKYLCITLDQDWCSTETLTYAIDFIKDKSLPVTVFVTDFNKEWISTDGIEYGVHPNFLANSSQGDGIEHILSLAKKSVPNCRSWRSHSLYQSTRLTDIVSVLTDWDIELNNYLPEYTDLIVSQFPSSRVMNRLITHWEDDLELRRSKEAIHFLRDLKSQSWIAIFNFHPIHLAINSTSMSVYDGLKSRNKLAESPIFYESYRNNVIGKGIFDQLKDLIEYINSDKSIECITISELVDIIKK